MLDSRSLRDSAATGNPTGALKRVNFKTIRKFTILAFCGAYLLVQAFFIIRAHFHVDKRFGFWMFAESSRYKAQLYRQLADGRLIKTRNGKWVVTMADRRMAIYSWDDYVRDFRLNNLEKVRRAKVGMDINLKYLQHALYYLDEHIPEDQETVKFILKVQYRKAGGPWQHLTLESKSRDLSGNSG